jgi:hypothetical protein
VKNQMLSHRGVDCVRASMCAFAGLFVRMWFYVSVRALARGFRTTYDEDRRVLKKVAKKYVF